MNNTPKTKVMDTHILAFILENQLLSLLLNNSGSLHICL